MARLIDADAYIEMMEEKCDHEAELDEIILSVCRGGIKQMPTIDAVEVVRCKDCKYLEIIPFRNPYYCEKFLYKVSENGFCSWGERKDGGSNEQHRGNKPH